MHSTIIEGQSQNYGMEKESQRNTHNNQLIIPILPLFSLLNNVKIRSTVATFFACCDDYNSNFFLNNYIVSFIEYLSKGSVYFFFLVNDEKLKRKSLSLKILSLFIVVCYKKVAKKYKLQLLYWLLSF